MKTEPLQDLAVVRMIGKLLIPFILLFALYVQFHGDFGPGGGFQAGVLFAAGFLLYGYLYGVSALQQVAPPRVVECFVALGLLLYGATGVWSLLQGYAFLDYTALDPHHGQGPEPWHGQHYGIMLVELGVGTTVCAVMITIFYYFVGRSAQD